MSHVRVVAEFGCALRVAPDSQSGKAPQVRLRAGLVMMMSALMTLAVDSAPFHSSWRG